MVIRSLTGAFALVSLLFASTALADAEGRRLQIVVSKNNQSMTVYDGGAAIATSRISTGKAGHSTPTGIFSILEKRKYHESNIYSNSPMPFMQRLTWSGIALHESKHVPSYPASHGCVRMPGDFAKSLFGMTSRGVHVIISDKPVSPRPIRHATLFQPFTPSPDPSMLLSDAQLRPSAFMGTDRALEVAMIEPASASKAKTSGKEAPLRMLLTRAGERERIRDIQLQLNTLGFDTGVPDGVAGKRTADAAADFRRFHGLDAGKSITDEKFVAALYALTGNRPPANGVLMVRQNFRPLFETPVEIRNPEVALGTHFFEVIDDGGNRDTAQWNSISLANDLTDATRKRLGITMTTDPEGLNAAEDVLSRLVISQDIRERIGELLVAGSSLTVSDTGHTAETGQGTDFITVTRTAGKRS